MGFAWWGRAEPPTDPTGRPVVPSPAPGRAWRLFSTRGRVAVRVGALCAALVVAEGVDRHDATHTASMPPGGAR